MCALLHEITRRPTRQSMLIAAMATAAAFIITSLASLSCCSLGSGLHLRSFPVSISSSRRHGGGVQPHGFSPRSGGFPPCLRSFLLSSTKTVNTNEIRIHTDLLPQIVACFYGTFLLLFHPIYTTLIVTTSSLPLIAAPRIVPTNFPRSPCAIPHGS